MLNLYPLQGRQFKSPKYYRSFVVSKPNFPRARREIATHAERAETLRRFALWVTKCNALQRGGKMEGISLPYVTQLFGIKSIEVIVEIALLCEPSCFGEKEKTESTLRTFFEDREAFVKRDLDAIHSGGAEYYFAEHARPYINALPEKELEKLRVCLKWGGSDTAIEKLLRKLFEKSRLSFLDVDKRLFIYHAVRSGYNLEHEARGVNRQLVNLIKAQVDEELADAKNSIPARRSPEELRELAVAITEREIKKADTNLQLKEVLQVGLLSLNGDGYGKIARTLKTDTTSQSWAKLRRESYTLYMLEKHGLDVEPLMPSSPKRKKS